VPIVIPTKDEQRRNEAAGFRTVWQVDDEYKFKDARGGRVLIGSRSPVRIYAPAVDAGLVDAFRKVRDEAALKNFETQFGSLGQTAMIEPEQRWGGGDHVKWALEHAKVVRAIWNLVGIIEEVKRGATSAAGSRKALKRAMSDAGYCIVGEQPMSTATERRFVWDQDWQLRPTQTAYRVAAALINEQICGIHYSLNTRDEVPGLFLQFRALIEIIYWHLADRFKGEWRHCKRPDCGEFFPVVSGRRGPKNEYCTPRCRNTDKKRRNRERKRRKEAMPSPRSIIFLKKKQSRELRKKQ